MFSKRSLRSRDGNSSQREAVSATMDSQHRVDKSTRLMRKERARDQQKVSKLQRSLTGEDTSRSSSSSQAKISEKDLAPSPIITMVVGPEARLFAAHQNVLCQAPFFNTILRGPIADAQNRRIALPEEPEVFSAILEYLYKGDYYPRLVHNKHRNSWELEDSLSRRAAVQDSPTFPDSPIFGGGRAGQSPQIPPTVQSTIYVSSVGQHILRDTVIYCAAGRYGLEELQKLALRKQGLHTGIDVSTVLRSAQYCYANTPDSDSRLRAHYLALIIRCRKTFKRSGTMQAEMEKCGSDVYGPGSGKLFFDLFVAMCNHLDDVIEASNIRTPKTV